MTGSTQPVNNGVPKFKIAAAEKTCYQQCDNDTAESAATPVRVNDDGVHSTLYRLLFANYFI